MKLNTFVNADKKRHTRRACDIFSLLYKLFTISINFNSIN